MLETGNEGLVCTTHTLNIIVMSSYGTVQMSRPNPRCITVDEKSATRKMRYDVTMENELSWNMVEEGTTSTHAARIVQSSHPIVLPDTRQRARKRPATQIVTSTTSATFTRAVIGPLSRIGALQTLDCHAWVAEIDVSLSVEQLIKIGTERESPYSTRSCWNNWIRHSSQCFRCMLCRHTSSRSRRTYTLN